MAVEQVSETKRPRLIGSFIRQRREALGLSQRALGLLFDPPVTTQFISNVERGVTPLPPAHIPTLTKALMVREEEMMSLLEQEYTLKLSGRLGKAADLTGASNGSGRSAPALIVSDGDYAFMRNLYDAYRQADGKTRQAFATVCESILNLRRSEAAAPASAPNSKS